MGWSYLYVGDAGNTSLVDAGHSSRRDCGRYPRECWLSTLGVLHPGAPVDRDAFCEGDEGIAEVRDQHWSWVVCLGCGLCVGLWFVWIVWVVGVLCMCWCLVWCLVCVVVLCVLCCVCC